MQNSAHPVECIELTKIIAYNLRFLRGNKSLREVAEEINTSPNTILRIEKAEVSPNISTLIKLAKYYDVPLEYILH